MIVVPGSDPPVQWCPHAEHDGGWGDNVRNPPTRNRWPLYGFDESVKTHLTRLAKMGTDFPVLRLEVTDCGD